MVQVSQSTVVKENPTPFYRVKLLTGPKIVSPARDSERVERKMGNGIPSLLHTSGEISHIIMANKALMQLELPEFSDCSLTHSLTLELQIRS